MKAKHVLKIKFGAFILASAVAVGFIAGGRNSGSVFTEKAKGMNGDVTVRVAMKDGKIADVKIASHKETPGISDPAINDLPKDIVKYQSAQVDAISGCTITSTAIKNAVSAALAKAGFEDTGALVPHENVSVTFTAGTYTATAKGYAGPVTLEVEFSDSAITNIAVKSSKETNHVGTPAFDILFKDAKEACGSGIDAVSGATFTSAAVKKALALAAEQAEVSDLEGFKKNKVVHKPQAPIEGTYDVVVIGGGGAGIAAAAQATQNGDTVLVIEKNAELGGNTVVSGGQFQSAMPYLCWEESNPDAATGVYPVDGKSYNKVKMANGNITVLKTILEWDEKPFDAKDAKDWFVAGDIDHL